MFLFGTLTVVAALLPTSLAFAPAPSSTISGAVSSISGAVSFAPLSGRHAGVSGTSPTVAFRFAATTRASFKKLPSSKSRRSLGGRSVISRNMAAEDEAARLKEQARKLKEEAAALAGTTVEAMEAEKAEAAQKKATGDLYDDEVAPYRDPLSDNMRERLRREASTGLDPNAKQTNVILYISIAVAALVLLGGKGILY